jgi:hypothetical protein
MQVLLPEQLEFNPGFRMNDDEWARVDRPFFT